MAESSTRTLAFLLTDIEGSTALWEQDPTAMDQALAHHANLPQLPQELTSFIGRGREVGEIQRLLRTTRLLTLTGVGGVGKTRLALRVARDLAGAYPDGVCLAELAALADPALVPQAVASVLGVREQPGRTLADTLIDVLRPRTCVLLLDNCEHLVESCAVLADGLLRASPGLTVLATSREPLGIAGETVWRVPPLGLPDVSHEEALADSASDLGRYEAVRLFEENLVLCRDLAGRERRLTYALHYLGVVARELSQPERAARLFGAAQALREEAGRPMSPLDLAEHERHHDVVRRALGDERFAAAWATGQAMSLDEAIQYALTAPPPDGRRSATSDSATIEPRPSPLSARELEVAMLRVRGLSNRQIAEELIISSRTASTHVAHILNKLGLSNRAQIAAWAVEQNLVAR